MTKREAQILQWIKETPLISQQEIADRANITRSSAAVHISNLMKKGKIIGKGYVLQESSYTTVIGAVNVDIFGTSASTLVQGDSNPGKVQYSFGGVGRNIADNMCRLGIQTELITVLGDDIYAKEINQHCRDLGLSLNHAITIKNCHTSTYLCINDEHGEMQLAVSDMLIYDHLTPEYLKSKLEVINRSSLVVLDTNLTRDAISFLMTNVSVNIFVDTVSTKKAHKIKPYLSKIHTIKANLKECELLTGIFISSDADLKSAAEVFLAKGVKNVFISLGGNGVYYANCDQQEKLAIYPSNIVNTTGCGDAFMAALVYGYNQGYDGQAMAKLGLACASICAESIQAINLNLTEEVLMNTIQENGGF